MGQRKSRAIGVGSGQMWGKRQDGEKKGKTRGGKFREITLTRGHLKGKRHFREKALKGEGA